MLCIVASATSQATAAPASEQQVLVRSAGLTLKVRVVRPGAEPGRVTVTGPNSFKRVLKRTATLKNLKPGRYKVKAEKVSTRAWTATPVVSRSKVRLSSRSRKATSIVDYATIVSRALQPLAPAAISDFTPPDEAGNGSLTTTEELDPGDIVASRSSSEAPAGLLVKVVSEEPAPGSNSTYSVGQATLSEALPRGSFDQYFAVDVGDPAANARGPVSRRVAPDSIATPPQALPVSCTSAAGSDGIKLAAQGGVDVDFSADWDFADSSISVIARPHASVDANATLSASGSCKLAETLLYKRQFAPINIQVGPVPIVILPKLEMFAGGSIESSGSVEVAGSVGAEARLEGKASRKGFKTSFTGPTFTKSAGFHSSAAASGNIYGKAVVTGEVYGVAGPHASVKIGVKAGCGAPQLTRGGPWMGMRMPASASRSTSA